MNTFFGKLQKAIEENNSLLCVGLDPRPDRIRDKDFLSFNRRIIDQTLLLQC